MEVVLEQHILEVQQLVDVVVEEVRGVFHQVAVQEEDILVVMVRLPVLIWVEVVEVLGAQEETGQEVRLEVVVLQLHI
jgi:hypothetical protein